MHDGNQYWSSAPCYLIAPNGVVLVYVPGQALPMTPEQFSAWPLSEMYKTASGRIYA
jgi:hypothetical protein